MPPGTGAGIRGKRLDFVIFQLLEELRMRQVFWTAGLVNILPQMPQRRS
jgi:hypothetical protein